MQLSLFIIFTAVIKFCGIVSGLCLMVCLYHRTWCWELESFILFPTCRPSKYNSYHSLGCRYLLSAFGS